MLENGKEDAYARVRALGPILLTLSLVSLFGMIGCIAISTYKNLYFYSILYLCGASTKNVFDKFIIYCYLYCSDIGCILCNIYFCYAKKYVLA